MKEKFKNGVILKIIVFVVIVIGVSVTVKVALSDKDTVSNDSKTQIADNTKDEGSKDASKDDVKDGDDQEKDVQDKSSEKKDVASPIDLDKQYEAIEKNPKIKKAYLTFDDGPSDNTKKILDILDANNVKATFFVIYAKGYDDVYKDIVNRGNAIALHTYTHNYSIYSNEKTYFDDLNKISDYVFNLTGVKTNIMRFPGGSSNAISKKYCSKIMTKLTKSVTEKGMKYFDWNASDDDAEADLQPKSKILKAVRRDVSGTKDVCLLMHDAAAKTTTVEALGDIISFLKGKGYTLLPITNNTKEFHHAKLNN